MRALEIKSETKKLRGLRRPSWPSSRSLKGRENFGTRNKRKQEEGNPGGGRGTYGCGPSRRAKRSRVKMIGEGPIRGKGSGGGGGR